MKNAINNPVMAEGKKLLDFSMEEINRAEEDVVNYLVCHHTRHAIANFLKVFLANHDEAFGDEPIHELLEKCSRIDDRFAQIDLSGIVCSKVTVEQNDCYCLDTHKLRDCVRNARQIEQMVSAQVPVY